MSKKTVVNSISAETKVEPGFIPAPIILEQKVYEEDGTGLLVSVPVDEAQHAKTAPLTSEQKAVARSVYEEYFSSKCGHINKQHINADGVREDLACTLPKGHAGNHRADYQCLRPVDGSIAQAKIIASGKPVLTIGPSKLVEVTEISEWSDAAGTLAVDVIPDTDQLARIKSQKGAFLDAAVVEAQVAAKRAAMSS